MEILDYPEFDSGIEVNEFLIESNFTNMKFWTWTLMIDINWVSSEGYHFEIWEYSNISTFVCLFRLLGFPARSGTYNFSTLLFFTDTESSKLRYWWKNQTSWWREVRVAKSSPLNTNISFWNFRTTTNLS